MISENQLKELQVRGLGANGLRVIDSHLQAYQEIRRLRQALRDVRG